jgi:phosphate/sulfate permease
MAGVSGRWLVSGLAAVLGSVAAFVYLDPIIAAFVAIVLMTAVAMAFAARDWDRHSTFEQRELERARRRAEKWERGKDARERDRVKWEAHKARREAKRAAQPEQ